MRAQTSFTSALRVAQPGMIESKMTDDLTSKAAELLPLTPLSFEILLALASAPRHGYSIIKEIERRSAQPMKSSTGTLYLAIQRLRKEGLIEASGDQRGRRRTYVLTEMGRAVTALEADRMAVLVAEARRHSLIAAGEPTLGAEGAER